MGKIGIIVDYTDNYAACPVNENIACISTGRNLEELKKNMDEALHFHINSMRKDGDIVPEEFEGEWEYVWKPTVRALLHQTEGILTRSAIAKAAGINQQQLSHYASGFRNPRPEMKKRIINAVHSIAKELSAIS